MVDPISVAALSALVGGVLSGATGEAGAVAFRRLTSLVRRSAPDDTALIERLDAGEIAHSEVVAECLLDAAASDDHISRDLEAWIAAARTVTDSSTHNSISGTVHGRVLQGRDFNGPINLG